MTITLPVYRGRHTADSGTLTRPQIVALRGLVLTTWIDHFHVHADRTIKSGKASPWSVSVTDTEGHVHGYRIEPDGTLAHARPRHWGTRAGTPAGYWSGGRRR